MATLHDIAMLGAALEMGLRAHFAKTRQLILFINPN